MITASRTTRNYKMNIVNDKKLHAGRPKNPGYPKQRRVIQNCFLEKMNKRDLTRKLKTSKSMIERAKIRNGKQTYTKQKEHCKKDHNTVHRRHRQSKEFQENSPI